MEPTPTWITEGLTRLQADYGTVPPPWVVYPGEHPYSICWRMGGGESHMLLWDHWWQAQQWDAPQCLSYFHHWPSPPAWLAWIAAAVWNLEPWDEDDFDYAPYFTQLEQAGLGTQAAYEQDLDDPKWLEDNDK